MQYAKREPLLVTGPTALQLVLEQVRRERELGRRKQGS